MSLALTVTLSGQPRGKGRPRATVGRGGFARVYTDAKTVTYESQLRFAAQQEMMGRTPTMLPVRVVVCARFQIPASWSKNKRAAALCGHVRPCTKPDADNTLKLLDALNGVVWRDDSQIVDARVLKLYAEAPSLTVDVKTIGPPSDMDLRRVPRPAPREPGEMLERAR